MLKRAIELFEEDRYEEAMLIFEKLARDGDKEAMYYMGMFYYEGYGVQKDKKKAIEWWKRADRRGSIDAKYMLQTISTDSSIFGRE
ncbi:tetratricopeptide repeat protein [Nitrosophilus labii]|uniref:tetratricopeptide repeat protein n=1 Tax=Nitrosophilus labii TaxID=2706014 RepID=UPI0016574CD1|nr:SEL1-like repeat protein [Nitrosophilus labii]